MFNSYLHWYVLTGLQLWRVWSLVLLVILSRGLANLLVPLPRVLPAGRLGVVVDVVAGILVGQIVEVHKEVLTVFQSWHQTSYPSRVGGGSCRQPW